jgi:hypothetical protein
VLHKTRTQKTREKEAGKGRNEGRPSTCSCDGSVKKKQHRKKGYEAMKRVYNRGPEVEDDGNSYDGVQAETKRDVA